MKICYNLQEGEQLSNAIKQMEKNIMVQNTKTSAVIVICDTEGNPVVLDNGKIYTSITNDLAERITSLRHYFRHFADTGEHDLYECSIEKKQAIEKYKGDFVLVPFKAFSYSHAKRLASDLEQAEKSLLKQVA